MKPLDRLLEGLDRLDLTYRRNGSGWIAQCPAHDDRTPSLSITEKTDRVLLNCHAGCSYSEVMEALGLTDADAFEKDDPPRPKPKRRKPEKKPDLPTEDDLDRWTSLLLEDEGLLEMLAADRGWTPEAIRSLGIGRIAGKPITISIPTRNSEGELIGVVNYRPIRGEGEFDSVKTTAATGSKRGLIPHPATMPEEGLIFLVEGEADAITATSLGLSAVGIPGANSWRPAWADDLAGREVVIIPDLDRPGRALAEKVKGDLLEKGSSVRVLDLSTDSDLGEGDDLGDYVRTMLADVETEKLAEAIEHVGKSVLDRALTLEPEGATGPIRETDDLLREVEAVLRRFVVLPSDAAFAALTLWTLHTHAFEGQTQTPYVLLTSAEKRCGKSRVLEVLEPLVRDAWITADTSPAALFRKVEKDRPTLLLDELDAVLGGSAERAEAIRGIINAGNRASGKVTRCVGQDQEVRDFHVFAPKLLAGIESSKIPDTIRDRSIAIRMKRRMPGEPVDRLYLDEIAEELAPLRLDLARWAEAAIGDLKGARPNPAPGLNDRAEEAWRPLLAIADRAGGEWPDRARVAATELSGGEVEDGETYGGMILRAIRDLLGDDLTISTARIVDHLNASDELPFGGWRDGKGIDARGLARLLRPYGIRAKKVRVGEEALRGYHLDDLAEPLGRYAPRHTSEEAEHGEQVEHGTDTEQETPHEQRDVPEVPDVPQIQPEGLEVEHDPEQGRLEVEQEAA